MCPDDCTPPVLCCSRVALIFILMAIGICPVFSDTPPAPAPAAGELRLDGAVKTLDVAKGSLVMVVTSFASPDGKTVTLMTPRAKTIVIPANAAIHSSDTTPRKLALTDLIAGTILAVVGKDSGTGAALVAREIAAGAPPAAGAPAPAPVETTTPAPGPTVALSPGPPIAPSSAPGMHPTMVLQLGHSAHVRAVAASLDSKLVATAGDDCSVKVWDAATGALRYNLDGNGSYVFALAFFPDGKKLASGGDDGLVHVFDLATGEQLPATMKHGSRILALAVSPGGTVLASAGTGSSVKLWDAATGALHQTLNTGSHDIGGVAFSPDGREIVSAGMNWNQNPVPDLAKVWNTETGQLLGTLTGHTAGIWAVAWSPDGNLIATGSSDKTVGVWDAHTYQAIPALQGHIDGVCSVAFSPDGKVIASGARVTGGGHPGEIRFWDAHTGQALANIAANGGAVTGLAYMHDGTLVSVGEDCAVKFWDRTTLKRTIAPSGVAKVLCAAFSPDGKWIAAGGSDNVIKIWNRAEGRLERTLKGHTLAVTCLAFTADGALVSGSADGTTRLWNPTTGQSLGATAAIYKGGVTCLALSPDGKLIASGGEDKEVKIYDSHNGTWMRRLAGYQGTIVSVAFSPDSKTIAVTSQDGITNLSNSDTGSFVARTEASPGVRAVRYSADGKSLQTAGVGSFVRVWDAGTGELLDKLRLAGMDAAECFGASPDGKTLAVGTSDGRLILCDSETGEAKASMTGHAGPVTCVGFSPDGKLVLSGGEDGIAKVWDAKQGKLLASLVSVASDDPELPGGWIAYVPDGAYNANAGAQRIIRWRVGDQLFPASEYENLKDPQAVGKALTGGQ